VGKGSSAALRPAPPREKTSLHLLLYEVPVSASAQPHSWGSPQGKGNAGGQCIALASGEGGVEK